jgi:HSP20 family molecular chaperone IbpA
MLGTLVPARFSALLPSRDDLLYPFQQYFDKLVDEFFCDGGATTVRSKVGYPRIDVITKEGEWVVEASVPGVKLSDLRVELRPAEESANSWEKGRTVLCIGGRMSEDHQHSDGSHYHIRELKRSTFERRLILPDFVSGEPEATLRDGLLRLVWKVPELRRPQARQVEVKE